MLKSSVCLSLILLMTDLAHADSESCRDALITSTYKNFSSSDVDWRLATIVTEEDYNTINREGKASAVIYGVPAGASYKEFQSKLRTLKSQYQQTLTTSQIQNTLWTGLSGANSEAYQACINSKVLLSPGLHLTVKRATNSDIVLRITWSPVGNAPTQIPIMWSENTGKFKLPSEITAGSNEIVVSRPDSELSLSVNAEGFGDSVTLDAIPPKPISVVPTDIVAPEFKVSPVDTPPYCDDGSMTQRVPTIYKGLYNLALLPAARAQESSLLPGHPTRHTVEGLNDGWFNNCRSWIAASMPAWAQIDLGANHTISLIAFGSEYVSHYSDRTITSFSISLATSSSPNDWEVVYQSKTGETVHNRREFAITPSIARYVKVDILSSDRGPARIDELEIYGR